MTHWGYACSELPPAKWGEAYPIANTGKNQSPIDITCTQPKKFKPFVLEYCDDDITSVENNGHSVTFHATKGTSFLSGGPLCSKYKLAQFHFHWGHEGVHVGSEHTLDGKQFDGEMHFVHWNSEKYASFNESLKHADGLCVLGAFIEGGHAVNATFKSVIEGIDLVNEKGKKDLGSVKICAKSLLPKDLTCYYHYNGSLTTPPLSECVQWVVFSETIKMCNTQLKHFQHVHEGGATSKCISDNFRPVCPLNSRTVYKSF